MMGGCRHRLVILRAVLEPLDAVPSVWDKIDALGSVGSALLALGALIAASMLYKIESGRDQDARNEQKRRDDVDRRRQAAAVAMWLDILPVDGTDDVADRPSKIYTVNIANYSNLPIHDVTIRFADRSDVPYHPGSVGLGVMAPGRVEPVTIVSSALMK